MNQRHSSEPVEYQYLIPFVLPAQVKDGMNCGRGKIYLVTVAASSAYTINHSLGRIPQIILILDNGPLALGDRTISTRTNKQVVLTPTVVLSNALVWLV